MIVEKWTDLAYFGEMGMCVSLSNRMTDKDGYDIFYKLRTSSLITRCSGVDDYIDCFERIFLSPFCNGGNTKGYVRGLAVSELMRASISTELENEQLTVLDAGCGLGEMTTYLACKGFNVVGVDVSASACEAAKLLSEKIGVSNRCTFLNESLECLSLRESSVDFVIGLSSLHHFIKYDRVPSEFNRIMRNGAKGFFADSFGENIIYHIFHNKERMHRLGDVILTRELIFDYFKQFDVKLVPADWFVMLDKAYLKMLPRKYENYIRKVSKFHFWLDRRVPVAKTYALWLSGSVMTIITRGGTCS